MATTAEESKRSELVDPTRPLGHTAVASTIDSLVLQAIFFGNGRKEAIVNGIAVKEGSRVEGRRILEIRESSIVVQSDGATKVYRLRDSIFDK